MSATHRVESDSLLANQAPMNASSHMASATMGERIADQGTDGHDTHHRETHGNARLHSNRRGDEQCNHRSGEGEAIPAHSTVVVTAVQGTTLVVWPLDIGGAQGIALPGSKDAPDGAGGSLG